MFNKKIIIYCIKFLAVYCILYYGTIAIVGLTVSGGYYCKFIDDFLNYPALLRKALLKSALAILNFCGYQTEIIAPYKIKMLNGRGVKIVYSCLGIGLFRKERDYFGTNFSLLLLREHSDHSVAVR